MGPTRGGARVAPPAENGFLRRPVAPGGPPVPLMLPMPYASP